MLISPTTASKLKAAALEQLPNEAVGLVDQLGSVYLLPNHHSEPTSGFEIHKSDLIALIEEHPTLILTEMALWHSHPNGGVGPSRVDMQEKTPFKYHLVVTLIEDDIKLTFY